MAKQCRNCGVLLADEAARCDVCGADLSQTLPEQPEQSESAGQQPAKNSGEDSADKSAKADEQLDPVKDSAEGASGAGQPAASAKAPKSQEAAGSAGPSDAAEQDASAKSPQQSTQAAQSRPAAQPDGASSGVESSGAGQDASAKSTQQSSQVAQSRPAAQPAQSRPTAQPGDASGSAESSAAAADQNAAPSPGNAQSSGLAPDHRAAPSYAADRDKWAKTPQPDPTKESARWVAEVWVDPEWFRMQQSPDRLPSPGVPQVIGLRKERILIGRPTSEQQSPDIDCVADSGVSRRQAQLVSDGIRWFLEDLGSSNGTYVGQVDRPLPTEPIRGRVEVGPHDRIYVGSWTRIVIRPALQQEAGL